jgi:hypothetical protein
VKSILIAAMLTAAPAEQAQRPCLTQAQIEDSALFALPPLLEAAATACAPALPADAYLLNGGRALARTLAAESSGRWAGASAALTTMAEDEFPANLSETTARGLLHDLVLGGLKSAKGQAQCVKINRAADLLSPMPPRNLAGLIILAVEFGSENEANSMTVTDPQPQPRSKTRSKSRSKNVVEVQVRPSPRKPPLICPTAQP